MKHCVVFFLFVFLPQVNLWAQERFTVNSNIGCAPFTVEVTEDTDVTGSTVTQYKYKDGEPYTTATTYEYLTPGTYTIEQVVNNDLLPGGKVSYKTITVVEGAVAPKFTYYLCNNRQIFVTVTDEFYPSYWINFGDGNSQQVVKNQEISYTYPDNVPKTLAVVGLINDTKNPGHAANNDCGVSTQIVIPLNNLPTPALNQVTVLDQNRIELKYNIANNLQYQLERSENGNTSFTELGPPPASGTFIAEGLDTKNNFYCFRLALKDPCTTTNPDIHSNILCTAAVTVTAENNQNRISWNHEPNNVQSIELLKDDVLFATLNANETSFTDTDIICNVEYCYSLRLNYNQGFSKTENICVNAITEIIPPAINNVTINVFEKDIHLEWPEPALPVKVFSIEKVNETSSFIDSNTTTTHVFVDKEADVVNNNFCYKIFYEDECGNVAPASQAVCPLLLTVSESDGLSYDLSWTSYTGWEDGVSHYIIEKIDEEGNVFESINVASGTNSYTDDNIKDRQVIIYRITAVSNQNSNWTSFSNIVKMEQQVKVFLPTAFTPNNDQLNDIFLAKGTFIKELQMKIFSRWGELLFYSDDINKGWDGTFKGQPVQEGSYMYSVQVTDLKDKTISLSGAFMLIRNRKN